LRVVPRVVARPTLRGWETWSAHLCIHRLLGSRPSSSGILRDLCLVSAHLLGHPAAHLRWPNVLHRRGCWHCRMHPSHPHQHLSTLLDHLLGRHTRPPARHSQQSRNPPKLQPEKDQGGVQLVRMDPHHHHTLFEPFGMVPSQSDRLAHSLWRVGRVTRGVGPLQRRQTAGAGAPGH
jgi:hypothetical protein